MYLLWYGWTPTNLNAKFTLLKSGVPQGLSCIRLLVHLPSCPLLMSPYGSPAHCTLWFPGRCSFLVVSRSVALWAPATAGSSFSLVGLANGGWGEFRECDLVLMSRLSPREEPPGSSVSAPLRSHPYPSIFSFPAQYS